MSLVKISRFANDAAGLEKSLRFLQALVQFIAAYSASAVDAAPWLQARTQFALGRRYFRFLKFIDAFGLAFKSMTTGISSSGIVAFLETGKWSCHGMYLLLESFTLLDAMGIWTTEWAPRLFVEAMKFWFYSISFSIILSLVMLVSMSSSSSSSSSKSAAARRRNNNNTQNKKGSGEGAARGKTDKQLRSTALLGVLGRKLVIDCCDIFIPGSTTGWLALSSGTVGGLSMISSVLAGLDIWARVQSSP